MGRHSAVTSRVTNASRRRLDRVRRRWYTPRTRNGMARLQVEMLGGFQSRLDTGRVVSFPTRKAQALLAVLALRPGQWHSRDRLIALLWADTAPAQGRQSLRQTLLRLRRALPASKAEWFHAQGGALALNGSLVDVDVARFERLVADTSPEALAGAPAVYRGDFLDGFGLD